ncbi:MAG TPA: hypothetical protein VKU01_24255 [Bryobacteraceae bacterium]|nr:hypothetical protein [Bryobacteraceae bacterium]
MKQITTLAAVATLALIQPAIASDDGDRGSILSQLGSAKMTAVSTVPANGDQNPYGVAFVPDGFPGGTLHTNDILVSNFNDKSNVQGTGSTIVRIDNRNATSVFFQGTDGMGLTTALGVLRRGFVLVGSLPNNNGNLGAGALTVLDRNGKVVTTLTSATMLDGPWDLAVNDLGFLAQVFVSNVLSGTVTRIDLVLGVGDGDNSSSSQFMVRGMTQIASGYAHRPDPNALVVGPTGLAFDLFRNVLYVASTGDNQIFAIDNAAIRTTDAGVGRVVYKDDAHLHGPLGLTIAGNGDLITANGDAVNDTGATPNLLTEFTPSGQFVAQFQIDNGAPGAAFGLAFSRNRLAAVDDGTNQLLIWTLR